MSIFFHEEDRKIPGIDQEKIVDAVIRTLESEKKEAGNINFIYCSDDYLIDMNRKYLDHDFFTDIITFDYSEGKIVSGDIFMSRDRIEENAKKFGEKDENEFIRVCGHGIHHLLGQGDGNEKEKEEMRKKEESFIKLATE